MTSILSDQPLVRTRPVILKFSLYYPSVDASNSGFIVSEVMEPVRQLLCDNHFYLISSRVDGENLCPEIPYDKFDMNAPFFGDPNHSVLIDVPIHVEDTSYGGVPFMSWTIAFYVVQLGQPLIDMAQVGENSGELSDAGVSKTMNEVLRLAMHVSIMEGTMEDRLTANLPGAHISLYGEEVATLSRYDIFSSDDMMLTPADTGNLAMHQLMDQDHPSSDSQGSSVSADPSIVATAIMYESNGLLYSGIGMFATLVFLLVSLHKLGKRRRKKRITQFEQLQRLKSRRIQLGTEDGVSVMLEVGKRQMEKQDKKLKREKGHLEKKCKKKKLKKRKACDEPPVINTNIALEKAQKEPKVGNKQQSEKQGKKKKYKKREVCDDAPVFNTTVANTNIALEKPQKEPKVGNNKQPEKQEKKKKYKKREVCDDAPVVNTNVANTSIALEKPQKEPKVGNNKQPEKQEQKKKPKKREVREDAPVVNTTVANTTIALEKEHKQPPKVGKNKQPKKQGEKKKHKKREGCDDSPVVSNTTIASEQQDKKPKVEKKLAEKQDKKTKTPRRELFDDELSDITMTFFTKPDENPKLGNERLEKPGLEKAGKKKERKKREVCDDPPVHTITIV